MNNTFPTEGNLSGLSVFVYGYHFTEKSLQTFDGLLQGLYALGQGIIACQQFHIPANGWNLHGA